MGDPNRYKAMASNNQMLRDISKSLQHLHVREPRAQQQFQHVQAQQQLEVNATPVLQSQSSFEQQLGLSSHINALSQSAAGERRSYPRAVNSNRAALEKIGKDLQPFACQTGINQNGYQKCSMLYQGAKSNSFLDSSIDQRKLSIILSFGFDETLAVEALRSNPNQSVEATVELLNSIVARKNLKAQHHQQFQQQQNRVSQTQTQKLFNVTPYAPKSLPTNIYNQGTVSRSSQYASGATRYQQSTSTYKNPPNYDTTLHSQSYSTNSNIYDPTQLRTYSTSSERNVTSDSHYPSYSVAASYSDHRTHYSSNTEVMVMDNSNLPTIESTNSRQSQKPLDGPRSYEGVTMRQKVNDRKLTPQNRWSAEVLHASNSENFPNKPPPPYPGMKKPLTRIPSNEAEVVGTNTPVTVIFDEKNDRVNVVREIPEGFESVIASSPSSSGQSSPRSLQKEPPPYNFATNSNHQIPKQYSPQSSTTQVTKQFSPQSSLSQIPLVHPIQSQNQTEHIFAVPIPPHNPKNETHFMPINEQPRRGSPPPYPGSNSKESDRSSLNLDELESSVSGSLPSSSSQYSSSSASSSKKTSTATEPGSFNLSDSSSNTSPTPDGVERSCSPLPTFSNLAYHTMVVHPSDKKEINTNTNANKKDDSFTTRLKNYTPQAYKFYMEQHVENLLKLQDQRKLRRRQLEAEMSRVGLPNQAQEEMRKLLNQKESNYIRLKRAKMDRSMFTKVKVVGVGAFGEVTLVRKNGTNAYYAMKVLRKSEVLRRNQVAHVKAERDILAEADNEWVVKLYYSFQDKTNLYFVMDYVPGGDLMALLIKLGIFQPSLALFYISELVLAIESVHKLGFIHRDIKPDNVLIDKNGHIKLTDFGLCTGFRWTHDSKYYQPEPEGGGHSRQFSMEPEGGWDSLLNDVNCNCKSHRIKYDLCKPLQRRQLRRHMRCQAHSLVGTPNYIAPEVLMRIPYSQQCDWWSVGVILYEMLLGQPPFLAHSPAETQFKVVNWQQTLNIPKHSLPPESEDIIRRLCTIPEDRIGRDGVEEIKQHPYFAGVNFATIHQEQAPYIPAIRNATDTSNFDPVPENMTNGSGDDIKQDIDTNVKKGAEYAFYEFTFRHFFDDGGLANPSVDITEQQAKPKKRPADTSQKSMSVPNKVAAHSPSSSTEEKAPIYV